MRLCSASVDPFGRCTRVDPHIVVDLSASERSRRGELYQGRATSLPVGWRCLEATAKCVFHALSTTTTLEILPHIKDTLFPRVTKRHSGYHHYWHATRSYYIHTQPALATVGSHGHLPNRLRLHHQDGVGRRLCAITSRCPNEDPAAGQRDCMLIGDFNTVKLLTRPSRCPSFPQPLPSPPC
jgi:hypothetical protein